MLQSYNGFLQNCDSGTRINRKVKAAGRRTNQIVAPFLCSSQQKFSRVVCTVVSAFLPPSSFRNSSCQVTMAFRWPSLMDHNLLPWPPWNSRPIGHFSLHTHSSWFWRHCTYPALLLCPPASSTSSLPCLGDLTWKYGFKYLLWPVSSRLILFNHLPDTST